MRRALGILVLAGCAPALAPPASHGEPEPSPGDVWVVDASTSGPTSPSTDAGDEPTWPRPKVVASAPPPPAEKHLAPICIGLANLSKERPHTAACCYPAKEVYARPIRAALPAVHSCWTSGKRTMGRVVLSFRIEQDGTVKRVCSTEATTLDDEPAVRCILGEMIKVFYPSMSDDERNLCGLISLSYPLTFEP
jgi:hypothetical protein